LLLKEAVPITTTSSETSGPALNESHAAVISINANTKLSMQPTRVFVYEAETFKPE